MNDNERAVRAAFAEQSKHCGAMGSPFMERLCTFVGENLSATTNVGKHCLNWSGDPSTGADNLPLRFCGGLHALVLQGKAQYLARYYPGPNAEQPAWSQIEGVLADNEAFFFEWLKSPPQTNEVSRSAVVWPAFMNIAARTNLRIQLLELGASGGLNLNADLYRYNLGELEFGNKESALHLVPEWVGEPCDDADVVITSKQGCDLSPVNLGDDADRLKLRAYVWPDQHERMERLNAALSIARDNPVKVAQSDAVVWLEKQLAQLPDEHCTVIFSTVAWQYFPEASKRAGEKLVARAAERTSADAPLAWVQFETDGKAPGGNIRLRFWSGADAEPIDISLGRADFHGRWIDWAGG